MKKLLKPETLKRIKKIMMTKEAIMISVVLVLAVVFAVVKVATKPPEGEKASGIKGMSGNAAVQTSANNQVSAQTPAEPSVTPIQSQQPVEIPVPEDEALDTDTLPELNETDTGLGEEMPDTNMETGEEAAMSTETGEDLAETDGEEAGTAAEDESPAAPPNAAPTDNEEESRPSGSRPSYVPDTVSGNGSAPTAQEAESTPPPTTNTTPPATNTTPPAASTTPPTASTPAASGVSAAAKTPPPPTVTFKYLWDRNAFKPHADITWNAASADYILWQLQDDRENLLAEDKLIVSDGMLRLVNHPFEVLPPANNNIYPKGYTLRLVPYYIPEGSTESLPLSPLIMELPYFELTALNDYTSLNPAISTNIGLYFEHSFSAIIVTEENNRLRAAGRLMPKYGPQVGLDIDVFSK